MNYEIWTSKGEFINKIVKGFSASILFAVVYIDANLLFYAWLGQLYLNSPWIVFFSAPINIYEVGSLGGPFSSVVYKVVFYNTDLLVPLAGLVLSEAIEFSLYSIRDKKYKPLLTTKGALLFGALSTYVFSIYQRSKEFFTNDFMHVGSGSSIIGTTIWVFILVRCIIMILAIRKSGSLSRANSQVLFSFLLFFVLLMCGTVSVLMIYGFYVAENNSVWNHVYGLLFFVLISIIYLTLKRRTQLKNVIQST